MGKEGKDKGEQDEVEKEGEKVERREEGEERKGGE